MNPSVFIQALSRSNVRAFVWLALAAVTGTALVFLYKDSYQQDGPMHFLFARWAWKHQMNFVGVWGRPLFTFLYAFPALIGYPAAKLLTVLIALATAWQTWRLAQQLQFTRAELVIPFLFLQPSFLLLCGDTMTEPLFALVLVVALRLHLSKRILAGMLVASLLPLARPEGFFIGVLWGVWYLFDRRAGRTFVERIPVTLLLAAGTYLWAFVAVWIMNDPLWLLHNWPRDWQPQGGQFGSADIWWYFHKSSYIFGLILKWLFLPGLLVLAWRRRFLTGVSAFVLIFGLHALMYVRGSFGSAGYPRYFVCVSPLIAIITLAGWNVVADLLAKAWRFAPAPVLASLLIVNGIHAAHYVDGWGFTRDARAVDEMARWFERNAAATHPVTNLMWSQAYMCIVFDTDLWERAFLTGDRAENLEFLRHARPGTLAFWDSDIGLNWHHLEPADFIATGYVHLRSQQYRLDGWLFAEKWQEHGGPRWQELHLFYKPLPGEVARFAQAKAPARRAQ